MSGEKKLKIAKTAGPILYAVVIALFCAYTAWRSSAWLDLVFHGHTEQVVWTLAAAFFVMCLAVSRKYLVATTPAATWVCGISTFLFISLSSSIIISDMIRLVLKLFVHDTMARQRMFMVFGWICIAFVVIVTTVGIYGAHHLKTVKYKIQCSGMKKKCRMVLLSDLHIGYYVGEKHIAKMVQKVNSLCPDVVVIAGDIINAGNTRECPQIDRVSGLLADLQSAEGTFAILGNHDPVADDPDFKKFIRDSNICLLDDDVYSNERYSIVGRTTRIRPRLSMDQMLYGVDKDKPIIVLDHDPLGIREAAGRASLVLCGHTHKGQIFPLNLFVRTVYSKQECYGMGEVKGTKTVVSAGTGYFSMPMRVGSSCEIVCLDIEE